ncbi:MAG TPA: MFS transporter [Mycobacteriales bacterium]|nr:MFS transporter [Mycobacteriales bacterium]
MPSFSRARLGAPFARLLAAAATTNLADGVRLAAAPLLVASVTSDPAVVGGAVFVQQLPWLLLSLPVGAYVDRVDRRRLLVLVNVARALLAASLAWAVATGFTRVPFLYAALFAVGVAEVVADNASSALLPSLVASDRLPRANARLSAAFHVGNHFAGPPLGAWLFVAGAALPFWTEAGAFTVAAVLLAGLPRPAVEAGDARPPGWLLRDVREGLGWLWRAPAMRLLALLLGAMNVTFMAAFAVWVLYARERLGLSGRGFGLLLTASAVGGLAGSAATGRLTDRFGVATLLRAGLLVETAVHVVLATTREPLVAGATMVVFGAHAATWGVVVATVRQRIVPDRLRGRVGSVYSFVTMGGATTGALAGGFLARWLGVVAPFWIAAAGNTVLVALVWRRLTPGLVDAAGGQ